MLLKSFMENCVLCSAFCKLTTCTGPKI